VFRAPLTDYSELAPIWSIGATEGWPSADPLLGAYRRFHLLIW